MRDWIARFLVHNVPRTKLDYYYETMGFCTCDS
jgi:hypothetical protein